MKLRTVLVGAALLLVGCVQRDNPFDPVNLPSERKPDSTVWIPKPDTNNIVVLRDSASRSKDSEYSGNPQEAFASAYSGDTIWIEGGGDPYLIYKTFVISNGGTVRAPVVVRSFGGQAVIRMIPKDGKATSCLQITQPYVELRGLTFLNCETGIFATGLGGPLTFDSIRIVNAQIALDFHFWKSRVKMRHVQLTGTVEDPPFLLPPADSLDTLDFSWTPRTGS